MRILIADDDPVSRRLLELTLPKWGYELGVAHDGLEAWRVLERDDRPPLAVLDWMMPGMDGPQVCRALRRLATRSPTYVILLTALSEPRDVVEGLEAGADDFISKPFHTEELKARLAVGVRFVELQAQLAARVEELEQALAQVKQLRGLLPICSYCKKIRNDSDYWEQIEVYLSRHSDAVFSHGVCPECYESTVKPDLEKWKRERAGG